MSDLLVVLRAWMVGNGQPSRAGSGVRAAGGRWVVKRLTRWLSGRSITAR